MKSTNNFIAKLKGVRITEYSLLVALIGLITFCGMAYISIELYQLYSGISEHMKATEIRN